MGRPNKARRGNNIRRALDARKAKDKKHMAIPKRTER